MWLVIKTRNARQDFPLYLTFNTHEEAWKWIERWGTDDAVCKIEYAPIYAVEIVPMLGENDPDKMKEYAL